MTGSHASGAGAEVRKKQLVLVVDSVVRDAAVTELLLQNFGYSVTAVRSAEEALELITIVVPALIVTDLVLPGMSGFDLLARIRQDPRLGKIPVLVQSAVPDTRIVDRCRGEGCTMYLRKPVRTEDLHRAVQSTLEVTPRQNLRVTTYLHVSIDEQKMGTELITVLSDGGLFVKTLHPRPVGTVHTVQFLVNKRVISVTAEVLYVYGFGEGPHKDPGMGMRFTRLDQSDREFLQRFILSQITPPIPPDTSV